MWRKLTSCILRRIAQVIRIIEESDIRVQNHNMMRKMKRCGQGVGFWGKIRITGADQMVLGDNVHIGENAFIRAEGGLEIGDNTHISRNVVLYTINHRTDGTRIPYDEEYAKKPVSIGRNVWIGMNVCIVPGTTIGHGAIIGMGTVVSGTVPALSIVVGSKSRIVGRRDEEHYRCCEQAMAFGGANGISFQPRTRS